MTVSVVVSESESGSGMRGMRAREKESECERVRESIPRLLPFHSHAALLVVSLDATPSTYLSLSLFLLILSGVSLDA